MKLGKMQMLLLFGFLTWLLPFAASFFFYDSSGELTAVDKDTFKSIMVVFSTFVGTLLLVKYFDAVKKDFAMEGLVAGAIWAAMNWIMDFVVLVPIMKIDAPAYFMSIGMRYLMVPIMAVGMGMAIGNAKALPAQAADEHGKQMPAKRNRKK